MRAKDTLHVQFLIRLFRQGYRLALYSKELTGLEGMRAWSLFDASGKYITLVWSDEFEVQR